jgi:hypothetical protein
MESECGGRESPEGDAGSWHKGIRHNLLFPSIRKGASTERGINGKGAETERSIKERSIRERGIKEKGIIKYWSNWKRA